MSTSLLGDSIEITQFTTGVYMQGNKWIWKLLLEWKFYFGLRVLLGQKVTYKSTLTLFFSGLGY